MPKKSLVSESQANVVPANDDAVSTLLAQFDAPPQVVDTGGGANYAQFVYAKSKNYPTLVVQCPGIQEGEVALVRPNKPAVKLAPFKLHLLRARQFWADVVHESGEVLDAVLKEPPRAVAKDRGLQEHIETVVLCYLPDGTLAPARCRFSTAKAPAAQTASAALDLAATPAWGEQPGFKETLQFPKPFMRFTASISLRQRTSVSTGNKYDLATAAVAPSGPNEAVALGAFFKSAENRGALQACLDAHARRVEEVEAVAGRA